MTLTAILEKDITNGRIFALECKTEKKGLKGIRYTKHTTLTAQWGCNYANVAAVQDDIAERGGVQPNWFEHTEYDSIVRHKKDPTKLYLQIMNPNNFRSEYALADGTPTTKAELIAMGALKDEETEKPVTLVYALESIISIRYKETDNKEIYREVKAA
ncbi:MAG: hypothetical protein FWD58_03910 [Firmicutes bacterium]|nr:hypothetical protein [Bacillota bacterium]